MSQELIISISGLRGIVGENFNESVANSYGKAFGTFLKDSLKDKKEKLCVCIGRDSRPSGKSIVGAVIEGLYEVGVDVVDLGIISTPGVGVMIKELKCSGGVVITASHNPPEYNGIKLLLDNGMAPPLQKAEVIKQMFLGEKFSTVESKERGSVTFNEKAHAIHIRNVLNIVDREIVSKKRFKVVLDSVNGAGGKEGKKLLEELGCELVAINDEPTGLFPHAPEPTVESLKGLCEQVKKNQADIGFAQDPDADRLAVVDEHGNYSGEDYTLALAAKYIFNKGCGKAATTLSTSRMIDDVVTQAGGELIHTAVGEANVVDAMIKNKCIIGGEGNGGIIDLRICPIRNSLVGMAFILQLMAETDKTVSELAGEIKGYIMKKDKFNADAVQAEKILDLAQQTFKEAKLDTVDGCRFDFEDGWLHLRTSNTEPIMRIIVEAEDEQKADNYLKAVLHIRDQVLV
ncbi:MAG: phosphoglucosamine mutase [Planctomycetota bacterium]